MTKKKKDTVQPSAPALFSETCLSFLLRYRVAKSLTKALSYQRTPKLVTLPGGDDL